MNMIVAKDYEALSEQGASIIAQEIKTNPSAVLGLATGSTPLGIYRKLAQMHKEEGLDFSFITTFNLDEYYGLAPNHEQSYAYFMRKNLFEHVNIQLKNTHIPNGMAADILEECKKYDDLIEARGGIDLQLLGIGANGHIGFNEPSEELLIGTHLVNLTENTIKANSRFFDSIEAVPKQAITMGIGSIMKAKKILLLAYGKSKAEIISKIIDGKCSTKVPASILQVHPQVTIIIDKEINDCLQEKI